VIVNACPPPFIFPVSRIAERSFHGHGNLQADVAVIRAGIDVGLQVRGQHYVRCRRLYEYSSAGQLEPGFHTRIDTAVAGLYVQSVQPPIDLI